MVGAHMNVLRALAKARKGYTARNFGHRDTGLSYAILKEKVDFYRVL